MDYVLELVKHGPGEGAGLQHLCIIALCLQGQYLECDAISTAPARGGIQQLLEGDDGHPCIRLA